MPELPEVETIRRTLEPHLVGRRVVSATLLRRDVLIVPGDPEGGFARARGGKRARPKPTTPADLLEGSTIARLSRHGKQMAIVANDGRALVVQLGMSGQMLIGGSAVGEPTHVHARWELRAGGVADLPRTLRNGTHPLPPPSGRGFPNTLLLFRDPRRFGGLRAFAGEAALAAHWSVLGPDALDVTTEALAERLAGSRAPIKAALLDQGVVAGVGNIYADEALFLAGVHPLTPAGRVGAKTAPRLARAIREVLGRAVEAGGSTVRDYADAQGQRGTAQDGHQVYGRGGERCLVCRKVLAVIRAAQRTTTFCPGCQRRVPGKR